MRDARSPARRGTSLYITVMGVALIVSVMALTASSVGRLQLRASRERGEHLQADAAARGGIEYAINWLNRNPNWRNRLSNGVDQPDVLLPGGAGFRWRVTDAGAERTVASQRDVDLSDDARDHAVLRCVGFVNASGVETTAAYEVTLEPAGRALTCLGSAVHTSSSVCVESGATLGGSGVITSNDIAKSTSGTFLLPVEANGSATGATYAGGSTEGAVVRETPGEHVFDWYVERGTRIPFSALEAVTASTDRRLSAEVLSRVLNPTGEPNPLGIYVIDCESQNLRIRWTRLLGTLVLLNAGAGTEIENVVSLAARPTNYPVLLVQGDLSLDMSALLTGQTLQEGLGQNYNPPGAPDEFGVEDTDDVDSYTARLDGIVYATGTISVADNSLVRGEIIADNVVVEVNQELTVDHQPQAANYPPPGFSAGLGVRALPGTLRRVGAD